MTHETQPHRPHGELYAYQDDNMEEVFKQPGTRFTMAELAGRTTNPLAQEGCVYVQTVAIDPESRKPRHGYYYFDGRMIAKDLPRKGRTEGCVLDAGILGNPQHDIVIGQPWKTPLGNDTLGVVEAISVPWIDAYVDDNTVRQPNRTAPTVKGRKLIDALSESAGR